MSSMNQLTPAEVSARLDQAVDRAVRVGRTAYASYVVAERQAKGMLVCSLGPSITGLVQTEEYAYAIGRRWQGRGGLGHADDRLLRQQEFFERQREHRLPVRILLGESSLSTTAIVGKEAMRKQLQRISEIGDRPGIEIGIVPDRDSTFVAAQRQFETRTSYAIINYQDGASDQTATYFEWGDGDYFSTEIGSAVEMQHSREAWQLHSNHALDPELSHAAIGHFATLLEV